MTESFRLVRSAEVPLLQAAFHEFEHLATGAKLIHFECEDDNNVFAAVIPDVPVDERGTPHILEHCVITGGSKRYPDPRSRGALLVTHNGAWTGWEYTWYFYESRYHRDFLKQVDVHLDFLLEPLLEEETFWREGHHLEFEDPDDPSTPLRIRGVIFNEQKGIFALPLYVSWTSICRALFPGLPYALEHGGRPELIPDLTWQELREFHSRYYHPANLRLLTWGSVPLEDLLETVDKALSRVPPRPFEGWLMPPLERFKAPRRHIAKLPIPAGEDPAGRGMALMAWVAGSGADSYELLLYDVISELLMGTSTAPLRRALAESGLGKSVAETFDRYGVRYRDLVIAAGLQDVDPESADKVESLIMETIEGLVREGVGPHLIDSALRRLEFARRTLSEPQGGEGGPTSLFIQFLNTAWVNGGDPLRAVGLEADLARLEQERKGGRPIEDRMREWLLENPHRAFVILEPDPGADVRLEDAERARLETIKSGLTEAEKQDLVEKARRLRKHQEARTAPPATPGVETIATTPLSKEAGAIAASAAGVPFEAFPTRTNGITYLDLFLDVGDLPDELWDYLHLFSAAVVKAGAGARSPEETAAWIGEATGGLSAEVRVPVDGRGDHHLRLLRFGGRSLERRQTELVTILASLLSSATFTPGLLRSVIDQALGQAEQAVFTQATDYLKRLAGSHVRKSWALQERLSGFTHLAMLRGLAGKPDSDLEELVEKLEAIRASVGRRGSVEVFVAASSPEVIESLIAPLERNLTSLGDGGERGLRFDDRLANGRISEARTWGMSSAFNCEVIPIPGRDHPDAAAIMAASLLAGRWNRQEVATRGTAYGAYCDAFSEMGSLVHSSIRDPNIARTFEAFAEGLRRLQTEPVSGDEFDLARFQAWMVADLPLNPPARARRTFVDSRAGLGEEVRSRYVDQALALTPEDIRRVADSHLSEEGARATLASAEMVKAAAGEGFDFDTVAEA
ncbi:MAG: insulinase family protein [Actinomycetota bacterium]